jgi:hypothetical protein
MKLVETRNTLTSVQDFVFPLNVYARLIELEDGHVDYMHYGLFESSNAVHGALAQRRASELLVQHLPPPCKLLEVGVGLGTTLKSLCNSGYSVTGITPDAAQIAYARYRHGQNLPAVCSTYESFDSDPGSWQTILFQESGQYIDDIDLFNQADHLLGPAGEIVIMDEFLLRRDKPGPERLHYLEHFLRLADRFGFTVAVQLDLSAQAAPTLAWLLDAVNRHSATLKVELGISDAQLADLNRSNRDYQDKYASGHYGYYLLRLTRQHRPAFRLGRIVRGCDVEMRTLFAEVFGIEMSNAHWQWKYGEGRGQGVGVWSKLENIQAPIDEQTNSYKLVAHYGGTSREVMHFGQSARAFQACDLMVATSSRSLLTKKGALFLTAATFLEHELGYGAPHLLGIGFPNERAYRAPEHLGLYTGCLARIQEVTWPSLKTRPSLRLAVRELDHLDVHFSSIVNSCWEQMRVSLGDYIVGVRDFNYIQHRYLSHPDKTYRIFTLKNRLDNRAFGLFVLRVVNNQEAGESRCEMLDAVCALQRMPILTYHARRVATQLGCSSLFSWVSDNLLPHFELPKDSSVQDLNVIVPGNSWTAGPTIESLVGHWWLTGGDTDFH